MQRRVNTFCSHVNMAINFGSLGPDIYIQLFQTRTWQSNIAFVLVLYFFVKRLQMSQKKCILFVSALRALVVAVLLGSPQCAEKASSATHFFSNRHMRSQQLVPLLN
jgi:hypothetical protein